jgi:hypothetical protein
MLDKKITSISTDYNNMQEQIKIIQMDMPIDSYLSSTHFLAKTSQLRSRNSTSPSTQKKTETKNASPPKTIKSKYTPTKISMQLLLGYRVDNHSKIAITNYSKGQR